MTNLSTLCTQRFKINIHNALGSYVFTECGKTLLDFTSGIAVLSTGHMHPIVNTALREQLEKPIHIQQHVYGSRLNERTAKRLLGYTTFDRLMWSCTGTEATENALKLAKAATKRNGIICFQGAHHGRSIACMSISSSKSEMNTHTGTGIPSVYTLKYPFAHESTCIDTMFQELFDTRIHPHDAAAVIIEPVLGEGAYTEASRTALKNIGHICNKHGILCVIDEVQSGFARTGKMFAYQNYDIKPDIVLSAKGIASGMPLSCIMYNSEIEKNCTPGILGGTYGANQLSLAACNATIDIIERFELMKRADELGITLKQKIIRICSDNNVDVRVSGIGLMIGVHFLSGINRDVFIQKMFHSNVLILPAGHGQSLRLCPPLTLDDSELYQFIEAFQYCMKSTKRYDLDIQYVS